MRVQKMIVLCRKADAQSLQNVLETGGLGLAMIKREAFQLAMQTKGLGRFVKRMLL